MSAPFLAAFRSEAVGKQRPSALLLHCGMLMTGLAMTLLGPILPLVMADWGLRDSQGGLLLTAQFVGMSLGSVAIRRELNRSLLTGTAGSAVGYAGMALTAWIHSGPVSARLPAGCLFLSVAGFGLGQLITSVNLIGGQRFKRKTGSALSLLNFSWSVGAMLSPLVASALGAQFSLTALFGGAAGVFVLLGLEALREHTFSGAAAGSYRRDDVPGTGLPHLPQLPELSHEATPKGISARTFLYFGAVFFLYGGVEACMNGWLTTYTFRYGHKGLSVSESSVFLFWASLTLGRGLASLLLLGLTEGALRLAGLGLAMVAMAALILAHSVVAISICAVMIGLGLAPCFPATLSLLLRRSPQPRQAAWALALTALGGAALSWMLGETSMRTHSLQGALVLPLISSAVLLALCIRLGGERSIDLTR